MRHANLTNHTSSHPRDMRRHQILLLHIHPDHTLSTLKTYIYSQDYYLSTLVVSVNKDLTNNEVLPSILLDLNYMHLLIWAILVVRIVNIGARNR